MEYKGINPKTIKALCGVTHAKTIKHWNLFVQEWNTKMINRSLKLTFACCRAQQDEAFEHLQWNNHHGDKTPTDPESRLSVITQEGRRKGETCSHLVFIFLSKKSLKRHLSQSTPVNQLWIYCSTNIWRSQTETGGGSCSLWGFRGPDPEACWSYIHILFLLNTFQ